MAGGGSKFAVYTAISANIIVMVAKFGGFALTGSGSMLSEGIHSLADVGNQALLAVGMKRAHTAPDDEHPFGYGREAFIWSLISAVGMFFLGCGVSLTHGIQQLLSGAEAHQTNGSINLIILAIALLLEGASLGVAVKSLMGDAAKEGISLGEHLRTTDDPFGIAVLFEDGAAVLGVLVALAAVGLSEFTHAPYWDPLGSVAIGLLLGFVAFYLIYKNRSLLIGRAIRKQDQQKLEDIFEQDPAVEHVAISRTMVEGTDSYRISAEIDFDGRVLAHRYLETTDLAALHARLDSPDKLHTFLEEYGEVMMEIVGDEIDRIEARIKEALPKADGIAIEPD